MRKLAILLGTLSVTGAMATSIATAQDDDAIAKFTALDVDQSTLVSFEELTVFIPDLTAEQFAAADIDASGELDQNEFTQMLEMMSK